MPDSRGDSTERSLGREPIILPGFAIQEQLEINFDTVAFGAAWLRKMYTDEDFNERVCGDSRKSREAKLREIRYGNNITLLFRVCYYCSNFYGSSSFWPAISSGYGAKPGIAQSVANTLIRARKAYIRRHGSADRFHSALTKAVDYWIQFIEGRGELMKRATTGSEKDPRVFDRAVRYFDDAKTPKFVQRDSAQMLSESDWDIVRPLRKRPRSPSPSGMAEYSSIKRRPSSREFSVPEPPAASADCYRPTLVPLKTELPTPGQVRHAYRTPSSANDSTRRDDYFSASAPRETIHRIRGCAAGQDRSRSPSAGQPRLSPSEKSYRGLEATNHLLRGKFDEQEKQKVEVQQKINAGQKLDARERAEAEQLDKTRGHFEEKSMGYKDKGLSIEKREAVADAHSDLLSMIKGMEKRLVEIETQRAKDTEHAQSVIASLESKLSAAISVQSFQTLRDEVATLEVRQQAPPGPAADTAAVRDAEAKLLFLEKRMNAAEARIEAKNLTELGVHTQEMEARLASVECRLAESEAMMGKTNLNEGSNAMPVDDRIVVEKCSTNESHSTASTVKFAAEHLQQIESRVADLEQFRERLPTPTERKDHNLADFDHLAQTMQDRLAEVEGKTVSALDGAEVLSKSLGERVVALEAQMAKFSKTVEAPKMPKSPSPLHDVKSPQNMNDMLKKIKSLPTMGGVSDKVFQVERNLRDDFTKFARHTDIRVDGAFEDLEKKIQSLPTMSSVSDKVFHLEKSFRDELGRLSRDTSVRLDEVTSNLGAAEARIKGLNKLLNETKVLHEATADKRDLIKALEGKVAILSGTLKSIEQSKASSEHFVSLQGKVERLETQMRGAVGVSPAELAEGFKEVHSRMDSIQQTAEEGRDGSAVALLQSQVDTVTIQFTELLRHLQSGL